MDAQAFWDVIGAYNQHTIALQMIVMVLLLVAATLSYAGKVRWAAKAALGVANLFIGIVFFGVYGTEPIQKFFALPLYLCCSVLFFVECFRRQNDALDKPNKLQAFLLILYLLYPAISLLLGNRFPQMVTHVMPCPIASLSIAVYAGYQNKSKLLLVLLTIWGLTGVKAFFVGAYEDIILFLCGLYGIYLVYKEFKTSKATR